MSAPKRSVQVLSLSDQEAVAIAGGEIQWVPVRRRLGIRAFGVNAYRATGAGEGLIEDHVESPGQEELYVVVAGRMSFVVDGEELDCPAGTVVLVADPESRRRGIAAEDETIVLAVGGWPERAYEPLPWEPIYLAQESMSRGDWRAATGILERAAEEHPDSSFVHFRLACCHAQLGDTDLALRELEHAISLNPALEQRAAETEHLASLRGLEGWPAKPD